MKRLSPRLQAIFDMVPNQYDVIWDLCCDHGHLGLALMQSSKVQEVKFVDRVPSIMTSLQKTIEKVPFAEKCAFELLTMDASQVQIGRSRKNLVVISGLGGKATIDMVKKIVENNGPVDLLLSPKHHLFAVRSALSKMGYYSVCESISTENGRFYENIFVSTDKGRQLSPVGDEVWDLNSDIHLRYLEKLIKHYELKGETLPLKLYKKLLDCRS